MINANLIKARIVEMGMTQEQVAKHMQISPKTLSIKLKTGTFGLAEADKMIDILKITDPARYFFAKTVT